MQSWPLMGSYHYEIQANPPLLANTALITANEHFLQQCKLLFGVKCRACGGVGHSDKYCPTLTRLKVAQGYHPGVANWLRLALKRPQKGLRPNGEKADKAALLHLPYKLPPGFLKNGKVKPSVTKDIPQ